MRSALRARSERTAVAVASYVAAVLAAFLAAGIFIAVTGFPVLDAYRTIMTTSFRSASGLINTLTRFVPLLLMAMAFSVPFSARRFNIGGEGQLLVGAIGAAAVGILFADLPLIVLLPLLVVVGTACGAVWAGVAAFLRDRFGIAEILTTVLLNFVSFQLVHYVAGSLWSDPAAGHPTTIPIGQGARLPQLIQRPLHMGLLLALLAAVAIIVYVRMTPGGYELRATGANERAAAVFGVKVRRVAFGALILGGACGGLAGAIEVAGVHYKLIEGMHSNFMMLGIIVGLISRGNVIAVPLVAFAVSVLEVGSSATQRTIGIPAEMVLIIVGLVLLFVLLSDLVRSRLRGVRWMSS